MDRVIPPECSDCGMTEKCFHLTGGSVCEEVRREREVARGVEIERLTKLVATRYEHICSLQERLAVSKDDNKELRVTIKELRAEVKEAKKTAEILASGEHKRT